MKLRPRLDAAGRPVWETEARAVLRRRLEFMPPGQLAKHLGVTPAAISAWVTGVRRPNVDDAVQLEEILGVDVALWTRPLTVQHSVVDRTSQAALTAATSDPAQGDP